MPTRKGSTLWMGLALAALLGLAGAARADLASAQAAYKDGLAKQAAKDYDGAIASYQAALGQEPRYAYAWKQIGTCRYLKGDKIGAVAAYDKYLAVVKNDPKTQAFADSLRASGGSAPADSAPGVATKAAKSAQSYDSPFKLAVDGGFHTVSFADWNADWAMLVLSSGEPPSIHDAYSVGLEAGYKFFNRLEVGMDLDYFMVLLTHKLTGGSTTITQNFDFGALWIGPYVGYDLVRKPKFGINVNLGLGYFGLMGANDKVDISTSSGSTSFTQSYDGSTVGFRAGAGMDWRFGPHFGMFGNLGYRMAKIPSFNYSNSNGGSGVYKSAAGKEIPLDYSGVDFRIGASFYL